MRIGDVATRKQLANPQMEPTRPSPREANQKSARTRRVEPGLIIDFTADGQAIGIEITAPAKVSLPASLARRSRRE